MSKIALKSPVRITNQFRKGDSMVYDVSCKDVLLTLQVTSREDSDGVGPWHIQAFARHVPERPILDQSGKTRGEALRAVASSWTAKRGTYGFPALDWDAVAAALAEVRAI